MFIWVRLGLLGPAYGCSGPFWVHSGAPSGRLVHSGSHGLFRAGVGVVGIKRFRVVSIGRAKGSSGSFCFA